MKVAVIANSKKDIDTVINVFGMQNKEVYNRITVERVATALEKGGHNVRIIDGNTHVIEQLNSFMPKVVQGEQTGMVFNMAYGIQGVSRYTHIPSLLEMVGIPYVGSSPAGHGIALDKVTSKVLFQANGIPTPKYWVFSSPDEIPGDIPFPLIVKPKMEAVSLGIQVIHDIQSLKNAIAFLVEEFKQQILVEEFISGREFAVGLLGNLDPDTFPIVEFDFKRDEFAIQTTDDKLKIPVEKICPANIDEKLANALRKAAKDAFRALGVYDFARVDFRTDHDGNIYVLELNSMASLGMTGSYVKGAEKAGYAYESLINRMMDVAVVRYFGKQQMEQVTTQEPLNKKQTTPLHVRLRSYLRGNMATMEEFLLKMVEINTYVRNIEGVNSLGRWISNTLSRLGFHRQVYPRAEFGNMLYFTNHEGETNDLLVVGNLDNPIQYQDFTRFFEERGKLFGSGISRGKGGLAVLLGALQALRYTRSLKKIKCGIFLSTDESMGGGSSKALLEEISRNSKCVIGLRGAGLSGQLISSCSGSLLYNIEINRFQSKPGQKATPELNNPILFASQKITALKKLGDSDEGVSISIISMETKGSEVSGAEYTALSFLLRYRIPHQNEILEKQIMHIFDVDSKVPLKIHIEKGPRRPPRSETELTAHFYEQVENIAKKVEVRTQKSHSDTPSLLSYVPREIPTLDGFGPVTSGYGTKNEYVVKDSLIDRAVLLANIIFRSSKGFS